MATLKVETTNMDTETSDMLTQTSKGTLMGDWLRRYWWPVGLSESLKDKPTFIKILNEELVLFRDTQGRPGLVSAYCPHRRANLCLGNIDDEGIRCRYHGWLISREGRVLDTPGEPDDSFKEGVTTPAYPVQELGGLIFAYLGPADKQPQLPRYDFLAGEGVHLASFIGITRGNWLQVTENSMDPLHLSFTHAPTFTALNAVPEIWFDETPYGVAYVALRTTDEDEQYQVRINNLVLPSWGCSGATGMWIEGARGAENPPITARVNVPIDDGSSLMFRVMWLPPEFAHAAPELKKDPDHLKWDTMWRSIPIEPFHEYKVHSATKEPLELGYTIPPGAGYEDAAVVGSMPPREDRDNENPLPTGDAGLRFIRDVIVESVQEVAEGGLAKGERAQSDEDETLYLTTGEKHITPESADILRQDPGAQKALDLPTWDEDQLDAAGSTVP